MRIALIPTGDLELRALAPALRRAFPRHEFTCIPLLSKPTPRPFRSFTSAKLPIASLHEPDSSLSELVGAIVDQLHPKPTCDLVFVLEDLELFNNDNEATVIAELRGAITRHLDRLQNKAPGAVRDVRHLLRTSASFHLAVPMIESWLFADPQGPTHAGAPAHHLPPKLQAGCDPERFQSDDLAYSQDTGDACLRWRELPAHAQPRARPEWLKPTHKRESHPKRYMAWLCRDPAQRNCSTYHEDEGANALKQVAWAAALREPTHMTFLRSFIFDLADALACEPSFPLVGQQAPLTSIQHRPQDRLLRNL